MPTKSPPIAVEEWSSLGPEARLIGPLQLAICALPLAFCLFGLLLLDDLILRLEASLGLLLAASAALFWGCRRLDSRLSASSSGVRPAIALLTVALLLRLIVVPLAPVFSDDVYRYLWDGRVLAAGENPYLLAPDAPELATLRDDLWQELPHRNVPTVYPPLALALFALVSALPWPLLGWKLLLLLADLIGCALMCALAAERGRNWSAVAAYAWNPLLIVEGVGMGHLDVLGVTAALAAVWALARRAPLLAGLATALGVAAKLGPLIAIPGWGRTSSQPARYWGAALLACSVVVVPVVVACGGVPPGLSTYALTWDFNGPLFEPLWRLLDRVDLSSFVARLLDQLKRLSGHTLDDPLNRLYPLLYPQFLAKAMLGLAFLGVLIHSWRASDAIAASRRIFGGALLCSATVYPWYLLWVLPWAALERHWGWLMVVSLSFLAYLPQHRELAIFPGVWLLLWLPGAALAIWGATATRAARG